MNDPDAALLGDGDGHMRLGDRVHGRADDRNIQPDIARELRLGIGLSRNHVRAGRQQQHVVESKRLRNRKMNHSVSRGNG